MSIHENDQGAETPERPSAVTGQGDVIYLDPAGSEAVRFLDELYAGVENVVEPGEHPGWLTGVVIGDGPTRTFWSPVGDSVGLVRQLTPHIGRAGVYYGVATRRERLPDGRRGGADDCALLPALWVDIDIAGPGHKADKKLPTSRERVDQLLRLFPVVPSTIVRTGGGYHAYWILNDAVEAEKGARLNSRLHAHLSRLAAGLGFEFDRTCDAPRILRLPGTKNVKEGMGTGGADVTIIFPKQGAVEKRYNFDDLDELIEQLPERDIADGGQTQRLTAEQRASDYFTGDSPFAIFNRHVTCAQMMEALGQEFVGEWRDGSMAWKRPDSKNEHNFVWYADDDHLACYTDADPKLRQHREYHPHSLLIDGFFDGDEKRAAAWLIEQGYIPEEVKAKRLAAEAFIDRVKARQVNEQTAEAYAEAVENGGTKPQINLRGVEAFYHAQLQKQQIDTPLPELEEWQLPQLGFASMAAHGEAIDRAPKREWIVRGMIIEGQHGVLSAGAKTGKTTSVADLAVSVAAHKPFLGQFPVVKQGAVLVLLGEGGVRPFRKRMHAVAAFHGISPQDADQLPIYATERIPQVADDMQLIALAQAIAKVEQLHGSAPVMVVLDPWYLAAGGQAELGNLYAMGELLDKVQRIVSFFPNVAIMVVHHHNRNTAKSGVERMSGAGPMEWGRYLIALDADPSRDRTPEGIGNDLTGKTDVVIIVSVSGGEIPATRFAYRRIMATSADTAIAAQRSPDAAVITYHVEEAPVDPEKDPNGYKAPKGSKGGGTSTVDPYAEQKTKLAIMQHLYDEMRKVATFDPTDGEKHGVGLSVKAARAMTNVGNAGVRGEAITALHQLGYLVDMTPGKQGRTYFVNTAKGMFRSDSIDPSELDDMVAGVGKE